MSTGAETAWQVVIGLEVHVQLQTRSKLFCAAPTPTGDPALDGGPNAQLAPLCLGLPGALPRLNAEAVRLAVRAGLALDCEIAEVTQFARKCYLYPDLPKGYQTSQAEAPICRGGAITFERDGQRASLPLERIHLEEDAGRSVHDADPDTTLVDLSRAGVPLIEIVSYPALHDAGDAVAAFSALRLELMHRGICDGALEQGSMRCDANVSVRPAGTTALRSRCEIKNLNSMRSLRDAITAEARRQVEVYESGGKVAQETRLWDAQAGKTRPMRDKEHAADYRYAPDPDLPLVRVEAAYVAEQRAALAESASSVRQRFGAAGVDPDSINVLLEVPALSQALLAADLPAPLDLERLVGFLVGPLLGQLRRDERDLRAVAGMLPSLTPIAAAWRRGSLSNQLLAEVLRRGVGGADALSGERVQRALAEVGTVDKDPAALASVVGSILAEFPTEVAQYRAGKVQVLGFLVGQAMRRLGGRADARELSSALRQALDRSP